MKLLIVLFALFSFSFQSSFANEPEKAKVAPIKDATAAVPTASKDKKTVDESASTSETLKDYKIETPLNSIDYPELQVVPRASERLLAEAKIEKDLKYVYNWTFFTSGVATFLAGYSLSSNYNADFDNGTSEMKLKLEEKKNATMFSEIVGLSWLGIGYYLTEQAAYSTAYTQMKKMRGNGNDKKSELLQERLSDEAIESSRNLLNTLTYASVISNAMANAVAMSYANNISRTYSAFAFLGSFLPIIFPHRYIEVYQKQNEYKRKIYAPLVYMDYKQIKNEENLTPHLNISWNF